MEKFLKASSLVDSVTLVMTKDIAFLFAFITNLVGKVVVSVCNNTDIELGLVLSLTCSEDPSKVLLHRESHLIP